MEVEEGSLMGGGECSELPTHIMEPQVELDEELDHPPLEPNVEFVEPHVEIEEGTDQSSNVYPLGTLSVEFYEGTDDAPHGESSVQNFQESEPAINGLSHDSENTSVDAAIHDNSQCNSIDDTSLDADEITMDNSDAMDSSFKEEDSDNTNYNEVQRTYVEGFFSASASANIDESSNSSYERIPLSRFPSIVKVVERAEYETIQILYQLLYQRSAWDTQEILSKRILEFSGFNFNKTSEEYYNREVMLQTLPNLVLVKIVAILCLDQVKNVLSNVSLGRHDLINAIMEFLALPRKKSRAPRLINDTKSVSKEPVELCGCRSNCLSKFTAVEREFIATYHTTLKEKRKSDSYFLNLIQANRSTKKPGDDSKKHRDYKFSYKIKLGRKEVQVCKGGFMMLHNVKMSKLNHVQMRLKKGNFLKSLLSTDEFPAPEGTEEPEEPDEKCVSNEGSVDNSASNSVEDSSESSSSKIEDASVGNEENIKVDDDIKESISKKMPTVIVKKVDPMKISAQKESSIISNDNSCSSKDIKANSKDCIPDAPENAKKKLKDFPLVVKCLDEVSEELLVDLHFLLFLTSAEKNKLKENILEFSGFSFDADCEEYDERKEFLQRMSDKLITDVARLFLLDVLSKREEMIQNILSFLMKPDENFLKTNVSDIKLGEIEGFSDSDESIACEVFEKKVECIDLLSSGEDSDKEGKKLAPIKKGKVDSTISISNVTTPIATDTNSAADQVTTAPRTEDGTSSELRSSGGIRRLKDFETIRKIVNTHAPEYLIDIYELLFLKKHEPTTLRKEILDFSGFTFEKGSPDYVKRRLILDRMLYNNVRRVYSTLIHNSTEVKVFSKPTMINEIFQFLFKLPDHNTNISPSKNSEDGGDKPLESVIDHPTDSVLKKHTCDTVEKRDQQDITMNGVIKRFRKGEVLKSQARKIIHNVAEFCSSEASSKSLLIPLPQALKRASQATGVSEASIKKIRNEVSALGSSTILKSPGKHHTRPSKQNCEIDDFDKCVIRQTIQDFYIRERKVPFLRKLLPMLKEKIGFSFKKDTLCKVLYSMNFRWKKWNKRKVLMERPDIVFWRHKYLSEVRRHRKAGRPIVYIDETWVDSNLTFKKCWQDDTILESNGKVKNRLIFVHAGSSTGFLTGAQLVYKASTKCGDYHGQMNYENFEKWVLEKLLPSLQPNSVICMDNAPYHMTVENRTPTKYSTKKVMIDWLKSNGIYCDEQMWKEELFSLIDSNRPQKIIYKIDNLIEKEGHEVLRLPPYHCNLNAIEFVWSSVKRKVKEQNITSDSSLENLKSLLQTTVTEVALAEWATHCKCVENIENNYWDKDGLLEDLVDELSFDINTGDSDSEDTQTSESDVEDYQILE